MIVQKDKTVEERLEAIEKSVAAMNKSLQQAPVLMSMATDSIDEIIGDIKRQGVNVDDRIKDGIGLLGRLSEPKIVESLHSLLNLVEQGPGLVAMATDSVDGMMTQVNASPVKIQDRIVGTAEILEKLTDPKTVEGLKTTLELSRQAPGLVAMAMDSVDDFMQNHSEDVSDSLSFLRKDNLLFLKKASDSLSESLNEEPAKIGGFFGMFRILRDADRRKALGFFFNILKNLGKKL
jgi:uncharacterized protein YjgD (DUF1641 family)